MEDIRCNKEKFWSAHFEQLVAEVYARMHGKHCKGISTSMRSDLQLQDVVSSEDKTMDCSWMFILHKNRN